VATAHPHDDAPIGERLPRSPANSQHRLLVLWASPTGYLESCLRELEARDVPVLRVAGAPEAEGNEAPYGDDIVSRYHLVPSARLYSSRISQEHREAIRSFNPSAVLVSGWAFRSYRNLVMELKEAGASVIMAADTYVLGAAKAVALRVRYHTYLKAIDAVYVPGGQGEAVLPSLGFSQEEVLRGIYAADSQLIQTQRRPSDGPVRFVYVGRLIERKGIDTLLEAHARLHLEKRPARLTICGTGPLKDRVASRSDVDFREFVQPRDLPEVLASQDVLVLPSRYEPWGVVAAEGAAAGLALLTSDRVGAAHDLLIEFENGRTFAAGNAQQLYERMVWFLDNRDDLEQLSASSRALVRPYLSDRWATRLLRLLDELDVSA
jgi:glycosyltransferase involved in cell wall biosynthesis